MRGSRRACNGIGGDDEGSVRGVSSHESTVLASELGGTRRPSATFTSHSQGALLDVSIVAWYLVGTLEQKVQT